MKMNKPLYSTKLHEVIVKGGCYFVLEKNGDKLWMCGTQDEALTKVRELESHLDINIKCGERNDSIVLTPYHFVTIEKCEE